ncbi:hypothetical protein [Rhodovulum strictum]|uniref:Uncharacterized protein n=1 Tax=Rhodovulum strictum TaxID=58314 RepID=A0A844BMD3_9RHOB|nr:hypothetical protein [Rhodovulum strictum]MRH22875.1 hypothetical protein [Rhodovulum strictum]
MRKRNVGIPVGKVVWRTREGEEILAITYRWSLTGKQVTIWFTDQVPDAAEIAIEPITEFDHVR